MKIIEPSVEIIDDIDGEKILKKLEICGRTCYQSTPKEDSAAKFIGNIIKSGHDSVIEHVSVTVRFICSRGCSHQLVRHRLASFSQESMRFCSYNKDRFGKEITIIKPQWTNGFTINPIAGGFDVRPTEQKRRDLMSDEIIKKQALIHKWISQMLDDEETYFYLIEGGEKPEDARGVLPQDTKTTVVMTANLREWRHVIDMRCDSHAQAEIRGLCTDLLDQFYNKIPVAFDDLYEKYIYSTTCVKGM